MVSRRGLHRVVVFVRDGLNSLEVGIPHRLFGQAGSVRGARLYDVVTATLTPGEVRTDTDFTINVLNGPECLADADTVVIPACRDDDAPPTQGVLSPRLAEALSLVRPGTRAVEALCCPCSGIAGGSGGGFRDQATAPPTRVATAISRHEATRHRRTPLLDEYAENEYAALKTRRNHPTLSGW